MNADQQIEKEEIVEQDNEEIESGEEEIEEEES